MPGSPLASERQWRDALAACGFTGISVGAPGSEAGVAFQSVIAAVSDGVVQRATRTAAPVTAPAAPAPTVEVPVSAPTDPLHQVTDVFARVLEMAPGQLDPDLTFENYGVDSLVVLELTRALEAVYGPQSATLLFERITIRQLADHFRAKATPDPATPAPAARVEAPAPTAEEAPPLDEAERLIAGMSDEAVEELLAELLSQQAKSEGGDR
jgi:polyketide synthase PksN